MKKILSILLILIFQSGVYAMENKIKFDGETYNLSVNTENGYNYYPKGENSDNWHSKVTIKKLDNINPIEKSAEFAHQIQSEHPGASVLVYPDAGTVGYLLSSGNFYEYNTAYFLPDREFVYAKRFYADECNGMENARKSAIEFAEKYNKKYMELVNKEAVKYRVD